jgi:DNA-binding transcriptional LysR family regulator
MRRADIADLTAFVAVADHLSFRTAATTLGITPSALSHTMRHFEERLGLRLLNRTTRSVSLTDAGLRLFDRLRPAVEQISRGFDDLKGEQGHPFGRLRLYVTHLAGAAVIAPLWERFLSAFADVQLEVHTAEAPADIVEKGFDAGIGPRDWAAADMIAVRVMGPIRVAVVGAPAYFARRSPPRTPDDLARHDCVQYRRAAGAVFEWPFERNGQSQQLSLNGRIIVNNADLAVRAAVDGLGIAYTLASVAAQGEKAATKPEIAPATSSGPSRGERCPTPSMVLNLACGTRGSSDSRTAASFSTWSADPTITQTGTVMEAACSEMSSTIPWETHATFAASAPPSNPR